MKELALFTGTSNTARYLAGLKGPVVMHSNSCDECALNFLCLGGFPVGGYSQVESIKQMTERTCTSYNWGVCLRCWCLYFEVKNVMHVCTQLRDGVYSRVSQNRVLKHPSCAFLLAAVKRRHARLYDVPMIAFGCHDYYNLLNNAEQKVRWSTEHPRNLSENTREYLGTNGAFNHHSDNYRDDSVAVDPMDCIDILHIEAPLGVVVV